MVVGEIKSQIDSIWNDFWSGGLSNPLSVMEQTASKRLFGPPSTSALAP
jgi:hypothetical protein